MGFLQELLDDETDFSRLGQEIWEQIQAAADEERMYHFRQGGSYAAEENSDFAIFKTKCLKSSYGLR